MYPTLIRFGGVMSDQLGRVEANGLVIYTSEPEVSIPSEPVLPTDEELVTTAAGDLKLQLAQLAIAVGSFIQDFFSNKPQPPTTPGGNQPQQQVVVEKVYIHVEMETPIGSFKATTYKETHSSPATPAQPQDQPKDQPKDQPTTTEPKISVTVGEPVIIDRKPEDTPEPDTPEPDTPESDTPESDTPEPDSKIISPPDSSSPPSDGAGEKFDEIMASYLTMEFDTAEEAAIYLQQKVSEAGIEVRITERGYEVVDVLPDPAGVAAQLRALGIADKALIEQAVRESNSAIAEVEAFAEDIRATFPIQGPSVDADENETQQIGDAFAALVPEWIPYVPSGFYYQGQGTATGTPTPSATSTEIMPRSLLSMERSTPLGMNCRATVMTAFSVMVDTGLEPGYHVEPFVSVFDSVPQWSLRA